MSQEIISIQEFLSATAGSPRFHLKFVPLAMPSQSLFAPGERQIGMFHLTDGDEAFAFFNSFAGDDEWDSKAEDWTDAVWQTLIARFVGGSAAMAADANSMWNHVPVEVLADKGEPIALAVKGMVTYNVSLDGQPIDFLMNWNSSAPSASGE